MKDFIPGDLLITTEDMILRADNLAIVKDCADPDELKGSTLFPKGSYCMYLYSHDQDPNFVLANKNMIGMPIMIEREYLKLLSRSEEFNEDNDEA